MATRRRAAAVQAVPPPTDTKNGHAVPEEVNIYAPEVTQVELGGRMFAIKKMSIRQSYQFVRMLTKVFSRHRRKLQEVAAIEDEDERNRLLGEFDWMGSLPEEDFMALVTLILTQPDFVPTPTWLDDNVDGVTGMRLIRQWADVNNLGEYLGEAMSAVNTIAQSFMLTGAPPTNPQQVGRA